MSTQSTIPDPPEPASLLARNHTTVYHNPDSAFYVEGCGLLRLDNGTLLAVVPVVPRPKDKNWTEQRRVDHCRVHILLSDDKGQTWKELARLPRLYSAVPWSHENVLYLFANKGGLEFRNDDLLLLKSEDGGRTWSEPVTLFKGHFWNCDTGMVIRNNRLYWAVDDLRFGINLRGPCVICGDLSKDPMTPSSWRLSNAIPFPGVPDMLLHSRFRNLAHRYLEPNVIDVYGKLRVLATVKPQKQTTTGLAAVFDISDDEQGLRLEFVQYHPMPGGQLKFCVIWDEVSKMFWATVNLPVDGQEAFDWWEKGRDKKNSRTLFTGMGGNDRRFLMLLYGLDGLNWFQAGCIARAGTIFQSFMYARPVIDGDDLAIISRTSIQAPDQHDADHATFHRVRNFRKLALNLFPASE